MNKWQNNLKQITHSSHSLVINGVLGYLISNVAYVNVISNYNWFSRNFRLEREPYVQTHIQILCSVYIKSITTRRARIFTDTHTHLILMQNETKDTGVENEEKEKKRMNVRIIWPAVMVVEQIVANLIFIKCFLRQIVSFCLLICHVLCDVTMCLHNFASTATTITTRNFQAAKRQRKQRRKKHRSTEGVILNLYNDSIRCILFWFNAYQNFQFPFC